jgi:hypothetical protein
VCACKDITLSSYPFLSENKKKCKMSGNLSKLTQQSFRRMIILVARIYLAHDIVRCLSGSNASCLPGFNFATYPILKDALDCLETRLQKIFDSSSYVAIKPKSAMELLQSVVTDVRVAKQRLALAESATRERVKEI